MKGKILCPAGCQNPVTRITKAKEILKNPRPAGSWRPLKCIFSGKGKSRSQRAAKPRSGVILAKGKKAAHSGPQALSCPFYVRKNQTGAVCGSLRARFYRGAKIRSPLIFAPAGILLGSAFPKPCLYGLRRLKIPQNNFRIFQKQFRFTPCFSPISERTPRTERRFLPCENDITHRTAAG